MKSIMLLLLSVTAQAADVVPVRVDMIPVRVIHVEVRSVTNAQRAEGIGIKVEAVGLVGSTGWTQPTLFPRNDGGHAEDGYLEFDFKAIPSGNGADVVRFIGASIPIPISKYDPTKLHGVRVYGGGESIAEHKLAPVKGK